RPHRRGAGRSRRARRPGRAVRAGRARASGRDMSARPTRPPESVDVFLVAAEESGDRLGGALMRALRERTEGRVRFSGVGGREMAGEGLASLYPIDDLPLIGFSAIPRRLPEILRPMRFPAK